MPKSGMQIQVEKLYKDEGLTIEQICDALTLPEETVTTIVSNIPKRGQTDEQKDDLQSKAMKHLNRAIEVQAECMEEVDYPAVRQRAAEFIAKAASGNFNPDRDKQPTDNIIQFNKIILQSNEVYERQMKKIADEQKDKAIDI